MAETVLDPLFFSFQEALAGRYSLERELGRGGMGIVYLAREVRLDRPVAIKLLPPELAAHSNLRERFLREVRTAARLSHPYIVPIHSVDEVDAFVFYVMAYVDGETLADRVRKHGPLKPGDATRMMREVAWALAYAHAQGVVHRDIKPANILLERGTERAMVMDFGIARLASASGETGVGEVMGTPEYMSPEQACGEPVDGRSDLYSLGVVGYFAISGTLPFTGGARELLAKQVTQQPPPVASVARDAPRALSVAIDQCLAKDPAARFPTGEALADALASSLEKRGDIPVPLRVFLDGRHLRPLVGIPAMGVVMSFGLIVGMARVGVSPRSLTATLITAALTIGLPLSMLLARMRRLMRQGYGPSDLAAAVRSRFDRSREEFLYDFGPTRSTREHVLRIAGAVGLTASAIGIVGLFAGVGSHEAMSAAAFGGGYLGALMTIFSRKWSRLREGRGSLLAKLWQGRIGQQLGRVAGYRIGQRMIPPDRPTELGIAMSAEALYASFPKEQRKTLGDVPDVLHGLEAHARGMRARIAELDASLLDAQRTHARAATGALQEKLVADLRDARAAAEQRLSDVVTALETLRLDLLRLHAGAGSAESITQDLVSARALGDDVDRLIEGGREVEQVVKLARQ